MAIICCIRELTAGDVMLCFLDASADFDLIIELVFSLVSSSSVPRLRFKVSDDQLTVFFIIGSYD